MNLLLVVPTGLLLPRLPACRAPVSVCMREGTRPGSEVVHSYAVPADASWSAETPLPEALLLLDPVAFPSLSRARKSCRRGGVLVNGREARCINSVDPGDVVELQQRTAPGFSPRGKPPFNVTVLLEDDHLAVVLKPAGVVTHPPPGGATGSRSMRTAIMHALQPPPPGTLGALYRPHLVHRLDKPTSGLMLCAKTKPALIALSAAFAERTIHKHYVAIVCGRIAEDSGEVDAPIDGKRAVTRWNVTGRHRSLRLGGGHLTSVELFPQTGRTHQLRRHCAEQLGCPMVGDTAYGGEDAGSGLLLSAVGLEFGHPAAATDAPRRVAVAAEEPTKFAALRRCEHARWLSFHGEEGGALMTDGADGNGPSDADVASTAGGQRAAERRAAGDHV